MGGAWEVEEQRCEASGERRAAERGWWRRLAGVAREEEGGQMARVVSKQTVRARGRSGAGKIAGLQMTVTGGSMPCQQARMNVRPACV